MTASGSSIRTRAKGISCSQLSMHVCCQHARAASTCNALAAHWVTRWAAHLLAGSLVTPTTVVLSDGGHDGWRSLAFLFLGLKMIRFRILFLNWRFSVRANTKHHICFGWSVTWMIRFNLLLVRFANTKGVVQIWDEISRHRLMIVVDRNMDKKIGIRLIWSRNQIYIF